MHNATAPASDAKNSVEHDLLQAGAPAQVRASRRLSDGIDCIVNRISGEWLLSKLGLSNGGSVIVLRALFVSLLVLFIAEPASLAIKDVLDPSRAWSFDGHRLANYLVTHLTTIAVVFGSVYTALYARFSAQWRYLADVYNKIKEAEVKYSTQDNAAERLAEWKAGFAEDAQELHLATKKIFAQVIRTWLTDEKVKAAFINYTTGGEERYRNLMSSVLWAVRVDHNIK
ncbi:hypothetical protein BLA39750_05674 [Burkholderia lata]|uniref:Uncharacterized protein n=1 Tax=Burkholderia lata (strain ATCC 17760 / DSM 23089 / LMG 22485 / NCIMB 9086 / R18194 / 383) TaxID=482957 RepID=A0A6P3AQW8_BURL3|nr:hypothetical protein [Burkholderia lata]VWD45039.1 hypothetical protein BLA39750_05674 [Burkholderia lata]